MFSNSHEKTSLIMHVWKLGNICISFHLVFSWFSTFIKINKMSIFVSVCSQHWHRSSVRCSLTHIHLMRRRPTVTEISSVGAPPMTRPSWMCQRWWGAGIWEPAGELCCLVPIICSSTPQSQNRWSLTNTPGPRPLLLGRLRGQKQICCEEINVKKLYMKARTRMNFLRRLHPSSFAGISVDVLSVWGLQRSSLRCGVLGQEHI